MTREKNMCVARDGCGSEQRSVERVVNTMTRTVQSDGNTGVQAWEVRPAVVFVLPKIRHCVVPRFRFVLFSGVFVCVFGFVVWRRRSAECCSHSNAVLKSW